MILTLLLFTIANIILASIDSHKIVVEKMVIKHGINALVYIAMIAIPYFVFHNYFLILSLLFNRLLVFNISLSLFRKLRWNYISPDPKSIIDKIAKSIFGSNGTKMYIVYAIIFCLSVLATFIF